ncbi:MAG: hypothetical protein AAB425_11310, partial [Bdellovibrionota bacterium]
GDLVLASTPDCASCPPSVTIRARTRILEPLATQAARNGGTLVLLKFETGEVGWASASDIVGRVEPATPPLCVLKPSVDVAKCAGELKKAAGLTKEANGFTARIEGPPGADFRYPRGAVEFEAEAGWNKLDAKAAQAALSAMSAFKSRVMKALNLGAWDSPQNPFREAFDASQWVCKISECLAQGCFTSTEFSLFAEALARWADPSLTLPSEGEFQTKAMGIRVALNASGIAATGPASSCRTPGTGVELTAAQITDLMSLRQMAGAPKSGGLCTYDRESTLAKIRSLMASGCIERVRTGDPELVKLLGDRAIFWTIPYGKSKSFDRIYIDSPPVKRDCTDMLPTALTQAQALAAISDSHARDDAAGTMAKTFREEGAFQQKGFVDSLVTDPGIPAGVQSILSTEWMGELTGEPRDQATGKLLARLARDPTEDGVGIYAVSQSYRAATGSAHPEELGAWTELVSQSDGAALNGDALQRGMMLVSDWRSRDPEAYSRFVEALSASNRLAFSVRAMQAASTCSGLTPLVETAKKPVLTADEISGLHEILLRCISSGEVASLPLLLLNHPSESAQSREDLFLILKTLPPAALLALGDAVYLNPRATSTRRDLVDLLIAEAYPKLNSTPEESKNLLDYRLRRATRILSNSNFSLEERVNQALSDEICQMPEYAGLKPKALSVLVQALRSNSMTSYQVDNLLNVQVTVGDKSMPHFQCFGPDLDPVALVLSKDQSGVPLQARYLQFAVNQLQGTVPEDHESVFKKLSLAPILSELETRGDYPDDQEWSDFVRLERERYGNNAQALFSYLTRVTKSCKNVACVLRITDYARQLMSGGDLPYVDPNDPSTLWPGEETFWAALIAQAKLPGRALRVQESIWTALLSLAGARDGTRRLKSVLLSASTLAGFVDASDEFMGVLLDYDFFTQDPAFAGSWQAMLNSRQSDPRRWAQNNYYTPLPHLLSLVRDNLTTHPAWLSDPGVRSFLARVDQTSEGSGFHQDFFQAVVNIDPKFAKTYLPRLSAMWPQILSAATMSAGAPSASSAVELSDPMSVRRGIETRLLIQRDPRALGDLGEHWSEIPDAKALVRRYVLEDKKGDAFGNLVVGVSSHQARTALDQAFPFEEKLALFTEIQAVRTLHPNESTALKNFVFNNVNVWIVDESKTQALVNTLSTSRKNFSANEWYT